MANPAKQTPRWNNFGTIPRDKNHQYITQGLNYFMTVDATGTAVASPVAITTGTTTLTIPAGAVQVTLCGSAAFSYSEDSTIATSSFLVPASTPITIPCATQSVDPQNLNGGYIYLTTASTANISFRFDCL